MNNTKPHNYIHIDPSFVIEQRKREAIAESKRPKSPEEIAKRIINRKKVNKRRKVEDLLDAKRMEVLGLDY